MPSQSKARKFVGHKNQYVNGQKFATVACVYVPMCACLCVCMWVCIDLCMCVKSDTAET